MSDDIAPIRSPRTPGPDEFVAPVNAAASLAFSLDCEACTPCDTLACLGPIFTGFNSVTCIASYQYFVQTADMCAPVLMDPITLACCFNVIGDDTIYIQYPPATTASISAMNCGCVNDDDACFVLVDWSGNFMFCGHPVTLTLSSSDPTTLTWELVSGLASVSGSTTDFTPGPPLGVSIGLTSEDLATLDIGCDTGTMTITVPG